MAFSRQLIALTEALPFGVVYLDREERYVLTNRAYARIFGRSIETLRGKRAQDTLGQGYAVAAPHDQRTLSGEASQFELRVPASDGTLMDALAHVLPDADESGAVHRPSRR